MLDVWVIKQKAGWMLPRYSREEDNFPCQAIDLEDWNPQHS